MAPAPTHLLCEHRKNPIGLDELQPAFSWRACAVQTAYQVIVSSTSDGDEGDLWDSGKVHSVRCHGVCHAGKTLHSRQIAFWRVRTWDEHDIASTYSEQSSFEMGLLQPEDWTAKWIGWPAGRPGRAAYFRCSFLLDFKPRRARLYVTGLGLYESYINGARMDGLLQPAVSNFGRRVYYNTYDVAEQLNIGCNALAGVVGTGWYGTPIFLAQLEIIGTEGQQLIIDSARRPGAAIWTTSGGPILQNSIFDGETYDARHEKPGWNEAGYQPDLALPRTSAWMQACIAQGPAGKLCAQPVEPIRAVRELRAKALTEPKPGVFVFDFGQNHAGWARLVVEGPRNTSISLKYAETLNVDGTVNQSNLRTAAALDTYILHGRGSEIWEPSFTYHGYRYVQVEGWPRRPQIDSLTARVVRSDIAERGQFSCGITLLNRIHRMVRWTEESNLHGIPTDCPQRDERMGWLNDLAARSEELIYNFDAIALLTKFVTDIADTQDKSGAITDTAPFHWGFQPADPVSIAFLLIPVLLHQHYGETRAMERHYEDIRRWVDFLTSRSEGGILPDSHFGDWAPPADEAVAGSEGAGALSAGTPGFLVSTAFYYQSLKLFSCMGRILGKKDDAEEYAARAAKTRDAFHLACWCEEKGGYGSGNQACNSIALYFDLVPESLRDCVLNAVVADVEKRAYHLSTGNLTTKYLLEILAQSGRGDVALRIATQTTYPSWGFMLSKGATTLWERWEELQGSGMNSHNHPMLGSIGSWLYKHVAGLQMEDTTDGIPKVAIHIPAFFDRGHAEATLLTIWGKVSISWRKTEGATRVMVCIPTNCPATLHLSKESRKLSPGNHDLTFSIATFPTV